MTYKSLFMKDEELKKQLAAVTHADWFLKCMAYAKATLMDRPGINTDHLLGARAFEAILLDLADEIPPDDKVPEIAGLQHNLDTRRILTQKEKE